MKIYHNPRCKKSRAGLAYLEEKTSDFEKVHYLKDQPFTEDELKKLLKKAGKKPQNMIRTQEKVYKENYKGKELSDDEWIKAMVENSKLIQRPIVETDDKAVWADPPENIDELF
jgi:arsenate reductase (glutaredoxin)